jgi:hypothetical protein
MMGTLTARMIAMIAIATSNSTNEKPARLCRIPLRRNPAVQRATWGRRFRLPSPCVFPVFSRLHRKILHRSENLAESTLRETPQLPIRVSLHECSLTKGYATLSANPRALLPSAPNVVLNLPLTKP